MTSKDEAIYKTIFKAVNDALPRDKYDVSCQAVLSHDRDLAVVTVVAKYRDPAEGDPR